MEAELRRLMPNCHANNFSIRFSILKGYEVHVNFKRASSLEGFVGDMFEQGKIKFSDESVESTPIFGNDDSNVGRLKVFHDRMRERNEDDITKKAVIFNVHKDADEKKIRRALAAAYQFLWDDEDERVSRAARRGGWSIPRRYDVSETLVDIYTNAMGNTMAFFTVDCVSTFKVPGHYFSMFDISNGNQECRLELKLSKKSLNLRQQIPDGGGGAGLQPPGGLPLTGANSAPLSSGGGGTSGMVPLRYQAHATAGSGTVVPSYASSGAAAASGWTSRKAVHFGSQSSSSLSAGPARAAPKAAQEAPEEVEEAAEVQDAEVFQSAASVDDSPQAFQSMNQDLQLLRKQFETQKLNTPKTISEAEIRGLVEATIKIQVDSQVKEAVQVMVIPQVQMMKELQGAFKQSAEAQIALKKAFVQILEKAKSKLAAAGVSKVDLDAAKAQVEKLGGSDEAKAGFMKILETQMGVAAKATALQAVAEVEDMQVEMVKQQEQVAVANSEAMDKVKVILAQTLQNQPEPIQRKLLSWSARKCLQRKQGRRIPSRFKLGRQRRQAQNRLL